MNKKILISIIAVLILAAGIGISFIFQKPAFPEPKMSHYNNEIVNQSLKKSQEKISMDSPFGIGAKVIPDPSIPSEMLVGFDDYKALKEVGARWVRHSGTEGLVWDGIETKSGVYDWSKTDYIFEQTYKQGIKMLITVGCYNRLDRSEFGFMPQNMQWYLKFLKTAVERYDGDGINDAPGSPIVEVWQIENEVDGWVFWRDIPQNYAKLLKESYKAIKQVNPNAKVAIAGVTTPPGFYEFYVRVFDELANDNTRYFDILDFHWYPLDVGQYNYLTLPPSQTRFYFKEFVKNIRQILSKYGYDNIPIFITETAQYSDTPGHNPVVEPVSPKFHSETKQAVDLFKTYVYSLANGVDKVFLWSGLTETYKFDPTTPNGIFDNVGLINNPQNDGKSHKKLSYYTYKKMVEVLDGSDWNNIQTIQELDRIYIYKFIKNNKSIWVAWNDSSQEKQITISGISSSQVKIIQAVPKYESGKEVTDYNTAFETEVKTVSSEKITITLGDIPMFVEKQ